MRRIVVTDLTRFNKKPEVCIAGTDVNNNHCIRPMPYLTIAECQRLQILPGAILSGKFTPASQLSGPHQEDMNYSNLQFNGPSSASQFRSALEAGLFNSIEEGFEISLSKNQKFVPLTHAINRSIITIQIKPNDLEVVEDGYNPGRIKVHLVDGSGHTFRYLPITDLGFYQHAQSHHKAGDLKRLNSFISNQGEILLRIGLSRNWEQRPGYWMQVNGIYTFPEFHPEIRSYG